MKLPVQCYKCHPTEGYTEFWGDITTRSLGSGNFPEEMILRLNLEVKWIQPVRGERQH